MRGHGPNTGRCTYWPRLLLGIPFFTLLWVPSYNRIEPSLAGVPFFYWYQLAWVLLGAAIVLAVYLIETRVTDVSGKPKPGLEVRSPGDLL